MTDSSTAGDYERAVEASNSAEAITSVLYPNDHTTCTSSRICIRETLGRRLTRAGERSREGAPPEAAVLLDGGESGGHHAPLQEHGQGRDGVPGL